MLTNLLQQFYQLYDVQPTDLTLDVEELLSAPNQDPKISDKLVNNLAALEKQHKKILHQVAQHQHKLNSSIDHLLDMPWLSELPEQLVRDSAIKLKNKLKSPSILTLLSEMNQVIMLYQYVINIVKHENDGHSNHNHQIIEHQATQVVELIESLHIKTALREQLTKISSELKATTTITDLNQNFHQLIHLLIKNINDEKNASKYFLDVLNNTIHDVKLAVTDSVSQQQESYQQRQDWDKNLIGHVNNISTSLEQANEIEQMQNIIAAELENMVDAVKNKAQFDKQQYSKLLNSFKKMKENITAVENEALGYKSKLHEQQLLSMRDSLTKLPNRAALDERFAIEFRRAQQLNRALWVAIADIDSFKQVNDNYGHSAGDKTLQTVASVISHSLRETEFIARFGGEEFVILIPDNDRNGNEKMLNRVREKVKSIPFKFKDCDIRVSISIGATEVKSSDPSESFAFERADRALYKAKQQGRDRVIIY